MTNPLEFIQSVALPPRERTLEGATLEANTGLNLDKLPPGVVSGNTLIDYSAVSTDAIRAGISMALLFASRAADAAMKPGDDEDDRFAAYMTNLGRLGFRVSQTAQGISRFKKTGVFVHQGIIPFLTVALGGASVGPVILAALNNLQEGGEDRPWITLFDQQSRKFEVREMHFAAVSSNEMETSIRHVVARLEVENNETNVLFLRITKDKASFETATTTLTANNSLLAVLDPHLRSKLLSDISDFIMGTPIKA